MNPASTLTSDRHTNASSIPSSTDEAMALLREQIAETGRDPATSSTLAWHQAAAGDKEGARRILEKLPSVLPYDRLADGVHPRYLELTGRELGWGQSVDRALALAYLGDMDDAMTILEAVVAERAGTISWKIPREWDVLRSSPRFQKLWRSLGLNPSRS